MTTRPSWGYMSRYTQVIPQPNTGVLPLFGRVRQDTDDGFFVFHNDFSPARTVGPRSPCQRATAAMARHLPAARCRRRSSIPAHTRKAERRCRDHRRPPSPRIGSLTARKIPPCSKHGLSVFARAAATYAWSLPPLSASDACRPRRPWGQNLGTPLPTGKTGLLPRANGERSAGGISSDSIAMRNQRRKVRMVPGPKSTIRPRSSRPTAKADSHRRPGWQ